MQRAQPPVRLTSGERRNLRRILSRRFGLAELKDLAFDLGTEYSVFHQESRRAFCRDLVACHERRNQVRCLVTAALERAPEELGSLQALVDRLGTCEPWTKLQITLSADQTSVMQAGASKLEVVVVSKAVAIPSSAAYQFVTQ